MPQANLTLLSASLALDSAGAKTLLAEELRQLSEPDIDAACEALFKRKESCVLLENVELAVAATHFGQLKALGFDCEIAVLDDLDAQDARGSKALRNGILAGMCVLSVAVGGGYFLYSQNTSQVSPVIATRSAQLPETLKIGAARSGAAQSGAAQSEATQQTEFEQWHNRVLGIESLKRELQQLGSDQIRNYFIAHTEDLLARTVGSNYVTQLAIQELGSGDPKIVEHRQQLENNLAAMSKHAAALDRFYATLELADVYQQLNNQSAARSTFELARNFVGGNGLDQAPDLVIAEVALAEHKHLYGSDADRDAHLAAATTAASALDTGSGNLHEWAVAYIARGEAKLGLFSNAHRRLRTISDEKIIARVMIDVSNHAASDKNESNVKVSDSGDRGISVDDLDLVLKFVNGTADTDEAL